MTAKSLSVVVPIHNELDNIPHLYEALNNVLPRLERHYEIVLVDDGSTDGSDAVLQELARRDPSVKVVTFRRNYGQTAAMQAGLEFSSCDYVVTMDGDLQNDPADIPMMLAKLDEGFDLVHGWRKNRQDAMLNRKLPSKIANWIISKVTKFPIHDLGCTLKAIRREIAQELELYGEMHRFIPILAFARGAKCVEVVVNHHARTRGTTKYGIGRTTRVVLDLITVKYMLDYFASPMKLFGKFGLGCSSLALLSGFATIALKVLVNFDMTGNPLLLLTVFSAMASLQFFSLGLIGEVNARIYYGSQHRSHYTLRELINFEKGDSTHPSVPLRRAG
jgi:glycosyltransferase involved in cell wall biosynthesis